MNYPKKLSPTHLRLFVYGTLKKGGRYHDRYCAGARDIVPAAVWGRLFHLPAGYPALEVPAAAILVRGSEDILGDARHSQGEGAYPLARPDGDWDLVHGELMTLTDPVRDLPPIDGLEDFRPGGNGLYERVLVPVLCGDRVQAVWTYCMTCPPGAERIPAGRWQTRQEGRRSPAVTEEGHGSSC